MGPCGAHVKAVSGLQAYQRHTGPYFRWLHISSEFTSEQGGRMRALRFSFKLPEWSRMGELNRHAPPAVALRVCCPDPADV